MSLPLLQTKLYIPKRQQQSSVVRRPQLLARLDEGLSAKVTLVSAPAGCGKSTLLREWIFDRCAQLDAGARNVPVGVAAVAAGHYVTWLTLDGDDNDPARFLLYLIASLRKFAPVVGQHAWTLLEMPEPPNEQSLKAILTLLLNDLTLLAREGDDPDRAYVLVLEDYHVITTQPVHEALAYLIENMPPCLHVIIMTRTDPPLPLARWRMRDQLVEIRADDLRFSEEEAAAFLNQRMGLHLSPSEIITLEQRTEGWIAGLQLVSLSLQGHADKAGFVESFSGDNRYVLDYLVEEVLNQQPKAVQEFLLHTSILSQMCGPLCDALMNTAGEAQPLLAQLHQANLFLVPLDDEGTWYRFHPLFADVLRNRLHQAEPALVAELHTRASVWYEDAGQLADAIHHSLRAADPVRTAALLERVNALLAQVRTDREAALQMGRQASALLAELSGETEALATPIEPLTGRELDVLRLVAQGLSNRAIAEHLVISIGTVKSHLKHIFAKLAAESRTQAVAQARVAGLL